MLDQLLLVWTNPRLGKEVEYNAWYSDIHLPDLLRIPGLQAAQRFAIDDSDQGHKRAFHKYLTIYELPDRHGPLREIPLRRGTAQMPLTETLDRTVTQVTYVERINGGGKLTNGMEALVIARMSHFPDRRADLEAWFGKLRESWPDIIAYFQLDAWLFGLTQEQSRPHQPYSYFGILRVATAIGMDLPVLRYSIASLIGRQPNLVSAGFEVDVYRPIAGRMVAIPASNNGPM